MAELEPRLIIATPDAFACDGQQHVYEWANDEKQDIKIKKCLIWCGMSKGQISDFGAHVVRLPDSKYINVVGWDHYEDPGGLHQFMNDFHNDWVTVKANGGVRLIAFATSENQPPLFGGVLVWIWYTKKTARRTSKATFRGIAEIDIATSTMLAPSKVNG